MRSSKMLVGISIKDLEGCKAATRKAIRMANADSSIVALHIPKLVPEMMLSSMSDPGDADDDAFAALTNLPSKAGENLMQQIKEVAESEMKASGKTVPFETRVADSSSDVKTGLLAQCKSEKADFLVLGPGVGGNGSVPPFAVGRAKGMTVCVVRDHLE